MSKVATYLNEHLMGEALVNSSVLGAVSLDGGVLLDRPEIAARAANTSDIRKIMRFCWQLAEKGHVLPVVPRGLGGGDSAAIGSGVSLDTSKYMHRIVGIDVKQRLIHVQAGAELKAVNAVLSTHKGMTLPFDSFDGSSGTIGGAIASGAAGAMNGRYGTIGKAISQLEVVLASGEVLQTGKISKRELNAKKGLHTMEGEIYRQLDNLLSDNADLIDQIGRGADFDTLGYPSIVDIKGKDGSMDLTPLFVGSNGTLGIISEVIMKADFAHQEMTAITAAYADFADAQAAADTLVEMKAASVEIIDGRILERVAKQGRVREFAPSSCFKGALVVALFDDFSERVREKAAKKAIKQLEKNTAPEKVAHHAWTMSDLADMQALSTIAKRLSTTGHAVPEVFSGIWLPTVRADGFIVDLKTIEKTYSMDLLLHIDALSGFINILPEFDMKKVSDRQKLIKMLNELALLCHKHGGSIAGQGGDGRLKTLAAQPVLGDDIAALYSQIKQIFDPYGILNPGVKRPMSAKDVVAQLNAWCRTLH